MISTFLFGFMILLVYFLLAASFELVDLCVAAALYLIINGAGILRKSSRKPQIAGSLT